MKLFQTSDINIVNECRTFFSFELPSVLIAKKFDKFIANNTDYHVVTKDVKKYEKFSKEFAWTSVGLVV